MSNEKSHRIAFAFYNSGWQYGLGSKEELELSEKITPEEYRPEMKRAIFCPECLTPLSRTPEDDDIFSNSRTAHFKHKKSFRHIHCFLRVFTASGLQYRSEEEVRKAVQNKDLVLIGDWAENPPEIQDNDDLNDSEFAQTQIEDPDGPLTEVPLGRHTGKKVSLPTKISSVLAICRNFDKNIHRAFFFPDSQYALHLSSVLFNVVRLDDRNLPTKRNLYFGKIVKYSRLSSRNIIYLEVDNFPELKIYTWPSFDKRKKIDESALGRVLLFYGKVTEKGEGIPRCMTQAWGEYSLLPSQYERFLPQRK